MAGCGWHFVLLLKRTIFRRTIVFILIISIVNAQPQSFDYPNFNSTNVKQLKLEGNASTSGSAIQLTMNALDSNNNGAAGRVTYASQINLWDDISNEAKDFTTNFSFVISSNQSSVYGDGLAFFLSSPNLPPGNDKKLRGGALGVGLVDGNRNLLETDYQFLAVEFDTYSNHWDPDGTHVGININTMKSQILETWWTNNTQGEVRNCSIVYNSKNNLLRVSFTGYKVGGGNVTQIIQHLLYHVNVIDQLPKSVIVGISAATGEYAEEHTLLSWSFSTSTSRPTPSMVDSMIGRMINTMLLVGIGIGTGLFFSLLGLVYLMLRWMNKRKKGSTSEATSHLKMDGKFQTRHNKEISYSELATATNKFEVTQKNEKYVCFIGTSNKVT